MLINYYVAETLYYNVFVYIVFFRYIDFIFPINSQINFDLVSRWKGFE